MQTKVPYSGREEKTPQRTFISHKEKQAPGFKAGMDMLLFCSKGAEFMNRTALIYKDTNPET